MKQLMSRLMLVLRVKRAGDDLRFDLTGFVLNRLLLIIYSNDNLSPELASEGWLLQIAQRSRPKRHDLTVES